MELSNIIFKMNYIQTIKQKDENTANIQYAIIAGFCRKLKLSASKKHLCKLETIVP